MEQNHHVAIISYNIHSVHMNYGAALHSYAFQQYLLKNGTNSVIIDYKSDLLKGYCIKYPIFNNLRFWHIREYLHHLLNWGCGFFCNLKKYNHFMRFFEKNYVKTKKRYTNKELQKLAKIENFEFDIFVCESDVIWKLYKEEGFDKVFFLSIPVAKGKRKVAYGPSIGSKPFNKKEQQLFENMTSDFIAITTRESQGAAYLAQILGKQIEWVLDPTLLLFAEDYRKIAKTPKEKNYLLVYNCMFNDSEMIKEAYKYAKNRNLKVIEISNFYENKILMSHKVYTDVSIEEWLGYFLNASYVFCNAFHGFCFSVIFQKQVLLFQRDGSDSRMKNITDALGVSEHMIPYTNKKVPENIQEIDYNQVNEKLTVLREKSENFIYKYIIQ